MNQALASALEGTAVALMFLLVHWLWTERFDRSIPGSIKRLPWRSNWPSKTDRIGPRRYAVWQAFWLDAMYCAGLAVVAILGVIQFDGGRGQAGSLVAAAIIVGPQMLVFEAVNQWFLKRWLRRKRAERNARARASRQAGKTAT